jgi:hypothetical protein
LDRGADYTLTDKRLNTILHAMALEGNVDTAMVLMDYDVYGFGADAKNEDGITPMDITSKRGDIPQGFTPVFTKVLAGIRATRSQRRNPAESRVMTAMARQLRRKSKSS